MKNHEEMKTLNRLRSEAVRKAWAREIELVKEGKGTHQWTKDQQKELLETGKIAGYQGHHMKCCALYPQYAGDINNIQFLSNEEHLAAHNSGIYPMGFQSYTNGWYDAETGIMHDFLDDSPATPHFIEQKEHYYKIEKSLESNNLMEKSNCMKQDISPSVETLLLSQINEF